MTVHTNPEVEKWWAGLNARRRGFVLSWLEAHPIPDNWQGSRTEYAFTEMPVYWNPKWTHRNPNWSQQ